ncbi:Mur ligase family protein [Xylophilus ampelinus]|uniref:UDP-N-acetylmuramoylalanine--D-glutamate ligase n=1 Tax=Xylophilus ampelinus TaxID=54067 RepID=A0A318SKC4_9BURK|nr:Mur ligase family protein [Xylophilus ampelinus]MCS4509644.1 UDP-N-acetylmuramoyl-L-alanine--D-glutamate ligase [Xylophilus ampelinus]PYE78871.1 UDP-N-acetylmuramoylalanine--D-glutamate ligase [Xylophilus ampelinus]
MRHLQDLPVLVLGLGASGLAMARWCARHGAGVTVADTREAPPQLTALRHDVPGATFVAGPLTAALVEGAAVRAVYRSPGLPPTVTAEVLDAARALGLPVGGELDLFARALADLRDQTADAADATAAPDAIDGVTRGEAADAEGVDTPSADPAPDASSTVDADADAAIDSDTAAPADVPAAHSDTPSAADTDGTATAVAAIPDADDPLHFADAVPIEPPAVLTGYRPAVLAITGTNGKTTVTALTGLLVERAGKTVAVAGNIGPTLLDTLSAHIDADTLPDVWVLELSSFQLDGVQGFEPTAATVLNISQDHLDWHGSLDAYAAAKARVFGSRALMLLNREDPRVMAMLDGAAQPAPAAADAATAVTPARRTPFKLRQPKPVARTWFSFGADAPQRAGDYGIDLVNGMAWLSRALEADETRKSRRAAAEDLHLQRLMPADALRIRGRHNAVNALAALALAQAAGCALAPMLYGLREYRGEPHRVASVAVVEGVEYFDDSKGTNVGATVAALQGLGAERRIVVILGGDGKGQDFSPLAAPVAAHARGVVLIGRDAVAIRAALADAGVPQVAADTLQDAVQAARGLAQAGDAVLLSPACASFDMFTGYAHRARVFCEAVEALAEDALAGGQGSQDNDAHAPTTEVSSS